MASHTAPLKIESAERAVISILMLLDLPDTIFTDSNMGMLSTDTPDSFSTVAFESVFDRIVSGH